MKYVIFYYYDLHKNLTLNYIILPVQDIQIIWYEYVSCQKWKESCKHTQFYYFL